MELYRQFQFKRSIRQKEKLVQMVRTLTTAYITYATDSNQFSISFAETNWINYTNWQVHLWFKLYAAHKVNSKCELNLPFIMTRVQCNWLQRNGISILIDMEFQFLRQIIMIVSGKSFFFHFRRMQMLNTK